jgi:hypothetical protein
MKTWAKLELRRMGDNTLKKQKWKQKLFGEWKINFARNILIKIYIFGAFLKICGALPN